MRKLMITTAAALLGMSAPVLAQSAQPQQVQQPQQKGAKDTRDPNEIVCERQQELGSRIASVRVCKSRAQWAEERRTQRMDVDKAQINRDLSH